jgi:hypothetical protein
MNEENNKFGGKESMGYLRPVPFWRRYRWQIIIAVLALLLLVFAYKNLSLPLPTPKAANVLCQSGSNDNWRGWHLGSGWKRLGNVLLNDGSNGGFNGGPTLVAPASCQPRTLDYAVEAKIQVVTFNCCYSGFGINVRGVPSSSHEPGYSTFIDAPNDNEAGESGANISVVGGDVLKNATFNPGTDFHVYRAEVKGNTITFLIDGAPVSSVVDNRFISAGEVGLWCANAQIELSTFKVVKL